MRGKYIASESLRAYLMEILKSKGVYSLRSKVTIMAEYTDKRLGRNDVIVTTKV